MEGADSQAERSSTEAEEEYIAEPDLTLLPTGSSAHRRQQNRLLQKNLDLLNDITSSADLHVTMPFSMCTSEVGIGEAKEEQVCAGHKEEEADVREGQNAAKRSHARP